MVAAFGCLIMLAWYTEKHALTTIGPGFVPIYFNTALCLTLLSFSLSYVLWQSGKIRHYTSTLQHSEARLEAIFDNIVDGLITINDKGIVQNFNKACEKMFGYKAEEVIGKNIKMLMPSHYADRHDQYLQNYVDTGHAKIIGIGRVLEGRRKDGSVFPMDLSVAEIKLANKRLFSGIVRDITERKDAEEALLRTNQELEKFAYVASHDLKAPLRNIDNLAQWVIEDTHGILPKDAQDKLDLLRERIARLETLLDDILAYSRAGRVVDDPVTIEIAGLVENLVQIHVPAPYTVKTNMAGVSSILSPRTPLEQTLGNLLSNAVKHHDQAQGQIEIEAREKGNFIEFIIRDDGPGIPAEHHERVFQMFQTLQSRDKTPGSGLGMAIIKKLVEWHGGQVWIETKESGARGTTIHFLWPRNTSIKTAA